MTGTRTAFVAGATGYTGNEVVKACLAAGLRTVAHVRPDSGSLESWREEFTAWGAEVDTTPWEEQAMTAALARIEPDFVFALLGTTRSRAKRVDPGVEETYAAVDYGLTMMLLNGAVATTQPKFVYLSAVGARASAGTEYMRVRGRVEDALKGSPLRYVIAKPSFIAGADRRDARRMELFGSRAIDGALATVRVFGGRRLQARYQSMTGSELGGALVHLALGSDNAWVGETDALKAAATTSNL
jgi:uncharacterized protein YbjT (DUF2867 family)